MMRFKHSSLACALALLAAWPIRAEIIQGVMFVRGCEMS
jgi:hypothetical protein